VGRLSGGEQQRLQLAQALVTHPRLLLLDEPLASLDLRSQQEVSQLVADLRAEQDFAVVLVTHDVNPLLPVTDRVMYIAGGSVSVGAPDEVITSENLSRLYQAEVEVITDSRGRVFVVGLEAEAAHPHSPATTAGAQS
jgi:zinc/manganese transport system ATP-binding protein